MTVKISVVVPVYNPGEYINPLIDSLLRQTMPAGDFEAVFVDDGSTDDTPRRLDELARAHPHFRVIHTPNSGWPGRPRNIGVDHARGEYVQFVDNDDWLGDEALERLYATARRHGSDVVVGKEVRWPGAADVYPIFSENRPRAVLGEDPLLAPLTPHKMLRRDFLRQHGLRFPEGRHWLEDHLFVVRAYFLADVISVLSDYPVYCWHRRAESSNAGASLRIWREWYAGMEKTLDVVEEHTGPGELRDRLLTHWYRGKVLKTAGKMMGHPDESVAREFFDAAVDLVSRRFGPRLDSLLEGFELAHAALLRSSDFDGLRALVQWERELRFDGTVLPGTEDDGRYVFDVRTTMHDAHGPVRLRTDGDALLLQLPAHLPRVPEAALDVNLLTRSAVTLTVEHRRTGDAHLATGDLRFLRDGGLEPHYVVGGRLVLDPDTARAGSPLAKGYYGVYLRTTHLGRLMRTRATMPPSHPLGPDPVSDVVNRSVVSALTADPRGRLQLQVGRRAVPLQRSLAKDAAQAMLKTTPRGVAVVVPVLGWGVRGAPMTLKAQLRGRNGKKANVPLVLRGAPGGGRARLSFHVPDELPPDAYRIVVKLGPRRTPLGLRVVVQADGGFELRNGKGHTLTQLPEPVQGLRSRLKQRLVAQARPRSPHRSPHRKESS